MPSYHLAPSPLEVACSRQLNSHRKVHLGQNPMASAIALEHIASLQLGSEPLLSLDQLSMITLSSDTLHPLVRSSLEFSEEDSFSDASTSNNQRASFPDCTGFFSESFSLKSSSDIQEQSPKSQTVDLSSPPPVTPTRRRESVKQVLSNPSSKLPFAFLSQPYKSLVHVSKPTTDSRSGILRGSRSLNFPQHRPSIKIEGSVHNSQGCPEPQSKGSRKHSLSSIIDISAGSNHLDVKSSSSSVSAAASKAKGSYSPECQSHTMSSVFEDDSDNDSEFPYLKKVFPAWITTTNHKKSKSIPSPPPPPPPPSHPKVVKLKSRIFKSHRPSLSNSSS